MKFSYTREEAQTAARCEIGVGNAPLLMSSVIAATFSFICLGRVFGLIEIRSTVLIPQICLACAVIMFCMYLEWRIKKNERSILSRAFSFMEDGDRLVITENERELCSILYGEVTAVYKGRLCARLFYGGTSICLPLRVFNGVVERLENMGVRTVIKKGL